MEHRHLIQNQGTLWTTELFLYLWFCTNQLAQGTCWVLPEIPQHHLQEAKGSTAPLEQPWKSGWNCRNQQALGNAGWSKSQRESWAPSAIQSAPSTPLAALPQPKAMPEASVNLDQHFVTACIPRFTLPSTPFSFKSNRANLSIFPLRSFTLLHTL